MSSRGATRRLLSLALTLAIALWAESGVAMLSAAGHGLLCHGGTAQPSPPIHHGEAQAMTCCHERANSMPNCPAHNRQSASHCGTATCCGLCSERARPPAFLFSSDKPQSKQLSAGGHVAAISVPSVTVNTLLASGGSGPPVVVPVSRKKTDLRI